MAWAGSWWEAGGADGGEFCGFLVEGVDVDFIGSQVCGVDVFVVRGGVDGVCVG